MPRARREWSAMLADIRTLLREETAAESYWSDALLLMLFNQSIDFRTMELAEQHEGWVTDTVTTDLVADQAEYTLQEGTGRVKRVVWVINSQGRTTKTPLIRNENWSNSTTTGSGDGQSDAVPTYRLMANLIELVPAPRQATVGGLEIDVESIPARLVNTTDKLDLRFPDVAETLLIYDTAVAALEIEDAQGEDAQGRGKGLDKQRRRYERMWFEYTAQRSFGRVFSQPLYLGD